MITRNELLNVLNTVKGYEGIDVEAVKRSAVKLLNTKSTLVREVEEDALKYHMHELLKSQQ